MTHENSWMHRVWTGWRREIVRGALLFAVVLCVGLFIAAQVRAFNPLALMRNGGFDFGDHGNRDWVAAGRFAGLLEGGQTLWIRNLNGQITVESAAGDSFEVVAEKSWRHSDPQSVDVMMVPETGTGSVTICALWSSREAACGPEGQYKMRDVRGRNGDVMVRFVVRLPAAVRLDASTINGPVEARSVKSPLALETVNGAIRLETTAGPVTASTVNGSITAAVSDLDAGGAVELRTVNGSIIARVPMGLNASLEASTVNGRVTSDLPLQVTGKINPRHLRATIGNGGGPLRLQTVNGSVTIAELGTSEAAAVLGAPDAPVPPVPPARPRARATVRTPVP